MPPQCQEIYYWPALVSTIAVAPKCMVFGALPLAGSICSISDLRSDHLCADSMSRNITLLTGV
eukprot:2386666-Amphidinium_carterae.2